jgi:hypothetical protein
MKPRWYLLGDDGEPVGPVDMKTYTASELMFSPDRVVARDELEDGTVVSTVFLGLDHQFGDGPPLLYETLVFPVDDSEGDCYRTSSRTAAQACHDQVVAELKARSL